MAVSTAGLASDREAAQAQSRWKLGRVAIYAALSVFAVIYLAPLAIVLLNVFRGPIDLAAHGYIWLPGKLTIEPWTRAWSGICVSGVCEGIQANFWNSLFITIPSTIVSTALGAINGYVLSKWRFPGSGVIFTMLLLGVFIPPQISLLPWAYILGKLHLANNVYGLILIHCVQGISFATLFCRNFYAAIPDDLVRAARIDGAGFWRIFNRIILPLSPPILIVTVIWQFTSIWNEYLYGMIFTSGDQQPITAALMGVRAGSSSATVIIAALPPVLLFLFGGRYFVRGLVQGAIR